MRYTKGVAAFAAGAAIATTGVAAGIPSTHPPKAPLAHTSRGRHLYGGRFTFIPPASYGVPGVGYAVAYCPRGQHVVNGGWDSDDQSTDLTTITSSEPARGNGWLVAVHDLSSNSGGFLVRAVVTCD